MAERVRAAGWREVLIVAVVAVAGVLGAAILTAALPTDLQRVVFHTPLLIVVLVVGTGFVMWRIATGRPAGTPERPERPEPPESPPAPKA